MHSSAALQRHDGDHSHPSSWISDPSQIRRIHRPLPVPDPSADHQLPGHQVGLQANLQADPWRAIQLPDWPNQDLLEGTIQEHVMPYMLQLFDEYQTALVLAECSPVPYC